MLYHIYDALMETQLWGLPKTLSTHSISHTIGTKISRNELRMDQ